jgi:hypothetical protein
VERRLIEIAERLRQAEAAHAHVDAHDVGDDASTTDLGDARDFRVPR